MIKISFCCVHSKCVVFILFFCSIARDHRFCDGQKNVFLNGTEVIGLKRTEQSSTVLNGPHLFRKSITQGGFHIKNYRVSIFYLLRFLFTDRDATQCYGLLGCLSLNSSWFNPIHRLINFFPQYRDKIRTNFTPQTRKAPASVYTINILYLNQ